MVVSLANSIRFKLDVNEMATFDNKLSCEIDILGKETQFTPQAMIVGQTADIQIIVDTGNAVTGVNAPGLVISSITKRETIDIFDYYTCIVTATAESKGNSISIIEAGGDTYKSELINVYDLTDIKLEKLGYLKLSWTNEDNKYLYDYRTNILNEAYILGRMYEYEPKITQNIFTNDEETINQKSTVQRTLKLQLTKINPKIAEMVSVAMSHEYFFINEAQFVLEDSPEISNYSNYTDLSATLTQSNVIGLNTYGFEYPPTNTENNNCYIMINPIPISYIPSATGNTENLNEFVIASNGTRWFIDINGLARQFPIFPHHRQLITGQTHDWVSPLYTIPTTDVHEKYHVFLNGSKLKYSGVSATNKASYGIDYTTNKLYFHRTLVTTDEIEIFVNNY